VEVGAASVGSVRISVQEEKAATSSGVVAVEDAVGEEEVTRQEWVDIGIEKCFSPTRRSLNELETQYISRFELPFRGGEL
jgi:2-oxo-4-hydroxy-4-carboxy--5-ureidoimidazoline (OHCU) decarboxylase